MRAKMQVTVHLGEPYWRQVDAREVVLELPEGATVAALLTELGRQHPELQAALMGDELRPTVVLGEEIAGHDTPLREGARPSLVWALAGG